jgi:hypothetical protein
LGKYPLKPNPKGKAQVLVREEEEDEDDEEEEDEEEERQGEDGTLASGHVDVDDRDATQPDESS